MRAWCSCPVRRGGAWFYRGEAAVDDDGGSEAQALLVQWTSTDGCLDGRRCRGGSQVVVAVGVVERVGEEVDAARWRVDAEGDGSGEDASWRSVIVVACGWREVEALLRTRLLVGRCHGRGRRGAAPMVAHYWW